MLTPYLFFKHRFITMEDVDEAILKVQMGPEKKSRKMSDKAKKLTAYHEAGHAVAGKFLKNVDPVHYITIIPRGHAGGFTLFRPEEDAENFNSRAEMFESIVMALGGRIAEKLFLDDISTGASGDIQHASSIARDMVMRYGMSERFGFQAFNEPNQFATQDLPPAFSEETSRAIDAEVSKMVADAYSRAEALLAENREKVEKLARALLEKETMDGRDVEILVNGEPARPEDGGIQSADGEETQATGSEA